MTDAAPKTIYISGPGYCGYEQPAPTSDRWMPATPDATSAAACFVNLPQRTYDPLSPGQQVIFTPGCCRRGALGFARAWNGTCHCCSESARLERFQQAKKGDVMLFNYTKVGEQQPYLRKICFKQLKENNEFVEDKDGKTYRVDRCGWVAFFEHGRHLADQLVQSR